jgi:transcriptional regulator with XRE-family HTH domain
MRPLSSTWSDHTIARQFGERLLRARRQRGFSQEQLARNAYIHRTAIGLLERGLRTPRLDTVVSLAEALSLTPGELIDGSFPTGMQADS